MEKKPPYHFGPPYPPPDGLDRLLVALVMPFLLALRLLFPCPGYPLLLSPLLLKEPAKNKTFYKDRTDVRKLQEAETDMERERGLNPQLHHAEAAASPSPITTTSWSARSFCQSCAAHILLVSPFA
jgi:hypothetical protein